MMNLRRFSKFSMLYVESHSRKMYSGHMSYGNDCEKMECEKHVKQKS